MSSCRMRGGAPAALWGCASAQVAAACKRPCPAGQDSQRGKALREMGAPWRMLLTGTPLQVGGRAAGSTLARC